MKKVVLIVTIGATARTAYRGYPKFLAQCGWEVETVARADPAFENWVLSEGTKAVNIDFTRQPSPIKDLKSLISLYRYLKISRPDVVVSATPKAGLIGTLAAWLARVPTRIYQLWGLRLETEQGWRRRVLAFSEMLAIRAATQTVANSRSLAEVAESLALAPQGSIKVLGAGSSHGVSLERFDPVNVAELGSPIRDFMCNYDGMTVIFVGRITPDKGVKTLIDAVRRANESGLCVRLLLLGRVEDTQLAKEISEAPDYIRAKARVDDPAPYIAAADVLCLPTFREGFPNVVLEAAALEIPSIVTDATGAVDSVVDGVTGWVFPSGDCGRLLAIFREIELRPSELRRRGLNARARVEKHFEQSSIWRLQVENLEDQRARASFQANALREQKQASSKRPKTANEQQEKVGE